MNLHARLLFAYGYLVTLVLLSAVGAAIGFQSLGSNIGKVLDENFASVRASMDMLEALERQDSAVLAALLDDTAGPAKIHASEEAFLAALGRAESNVSVPAERPVLESIRADYAKYREARDRLVAHPPERPLATYERECFPLFEPVKTGLRELLELNHEAMREADRRAQRRANLRAGWQAGLAALALLSMGLLSRALRRGVANRLDELRAVAEAVSRGDLTRRAPVDRPDELGQVARQLNELLDGQQELRGAMEGRLSRLRQLLVGLLKLQEPPAALVSLSGRVVASKLPEPLTEIVERAASTLGSGPERLDGRGAGISRDVREGDRTIRFTLLFDHGTRPVGWLGRPVEAGRS